MLIRMFDVERDKYNKNSWIFFLYSHFFYFRFLVVSLWKKLNDSSLLYLNLKLISNWYARCYVS